MKHERLHEVAFKEWLSAVLDDKNTTYAVTDLIKYAFEAGWDAAIGYCMQPEEEEVPAGTAIPNEHTSNTSEPIVASAEGKVND